MSGALTVEVTGQDGVFRLVDDEGAVVGSGRAYPSRTRKGYVTLAFESHGPHARTGAPLRVPADWLGALEAEPRTSAQIARAALREARRRGIVREYSVRAGGRATIYPARGPHAKGKFYTENLLDTLAALKRLGFEPGKED